MTEYDVQAEKFLKDTQTDIKVSFNKHDKYFVDDKDTRDIYDVTITRGDRSWTFTYGQSLNDSGFKLRYKSGIAKGKEVNYTWQKQATIESLNDAKKFRKICIERFGSMGNLEIVQPKEPSSYDILASITKYDPDTFENFCKEYGYDADSKKAETVYKAVCNEWLNIQRIWNDKELVMLREIN